MKCPKCQGGFRIVDNLLCCASCGSKYLIPEKVKIAIEQKKARTQSSSANTGVSANVSTNRTPYAASSYTSPSAGINARGNTSSVRSTNNATVQNQTKNNPVSPKPTSYANSDKTKPANGQPKSSSASAGRTSSGSSGSHSSSDHSSSGGKTKRPTIGDYNSFADSIYYGLIMDGLQLQKAKLTSQNLSTIKERSTQNDLHVLEQINTLYLLSRVRRFFILFFLAIIGFGCGVGGINLYYAIQANVWLIVSVVFFVLYGICSILLIGDVEIRNTLSEKLHFSLPYIKIPLGIRFVYAIANYVCFYIIIAKFMGGFALSIFASALEKTKNTRDVVMNRLMLPVGYRYDDIISESEYFTFGKNVMSKMADWMQSFEELSIKNGRIYKAQHLSSESDWLAHAKNDDSISAEEYNKRLREYNSEMEKINRG